MARAQTFYCKHYGCWGITAACCIGRQFKNMVDPKTNYNTTYEKCTAELCPQGAAVLAAHPELVPKNVKPKRSTRGTRECPVCMQTYSPLKETQICCGRPCSDIAQRRTRSASHKLPAPDTTSSPSPIRQSGVHGTAVTDPPVGPGELVPSEVGA